MRKIRKGDKVQIIAGKDKGRIGKILKVIQKKSPANLWVLVEGVNVRKKHTKPNPQREQPGGIIPREAPMPASKVAIFDGASNKPSRVGIKKLEDGRKVRFYKASGEVMDGY